MKVGIVTYHKAHNYGAFLQAFALCGRLNMEENVQAEIINVRMEDEIRFYRLKKTANPFQNHQLRLNYRMFERIREPKLSPENCIAVKSDRDFREVVSGKYDVLLAGSDEIWKLGKIRRFPNFYWLPDEYGCIKASYAASSRSDFGELNPECVEQVKKYLSDFSYLSVRDLKTKRDLESLLPQKDFYLHCDPVFLYDFKIDKAEAREYVRKHFRIRGNTRCVAVMIHSKALVSLIKKHFGDRISIISLCKWNAGTKNALDLEPLDWVKTIAGCDFVVTNLFHGCCFSLIQNTPFFGIETRAKTDAHSKLYDLLNRVGENGRYGFGIESNMERLVQQMERDFSADSNGYSVPFAEYRDRFSDYIDELRNLVKEKQR